MTWWPWQPKQAPAHTAGGTAPILPLGGAHHSDLLSSPIHDMTLLAARGNVAWQNAMDQAQAEHLRKPEPGQANVWLTPPPFVQKGTWNWKSFDAGNDAKHTVIRVHIDKRNTYQHLIALEWAEFGVTEEEGREDLEALCAFICAAVNFYRAK